MIDVRTFTNIWELFFDMRISGSDDILPADFIPMRGWVCQKNEIYWQISLYNASLSLKMGDHESIEAVNNFFSLPGDERGSIVKLLNNLPALEKLNDLKAFW